MPTVLFIIIATLVICFCKPFLIIHIRKNGIKTIARMAITESQYTATAAAGRRSTRAITYSKSDYDVRADYKIDDDSYCEKPLNDIRALLYDDQQVVAIKYLKRNPRYFIIIV